MAGAAITNSHSAFQTNTKRLDFTYTNWSRKAPQQWSKIFNEFPNDARLPYLNALPYIEMGLMKLKPEGQMPAFDSISEGNATTFNFFTMALAYMITEEGELESPTEYLAQLPKRLSDSEWVTLEYYLSNIFNFSTTSGVNLADGVPLASTAHPLPGQPGQTYSNYAGFTALTPESLQNAMISMRLTPSDRGNSGEMQPQTLVYHPQLEKIAMEVLGSDLYPYSDENKINVVKGKVSPIDYRYLTNPLMWILLAPKGDFKEGGCHTNGVSFKWRNRVRTKDDSLAGTVAQRASTRFTFGSLNWRGTFVSSGA